MHGSTNVYIYWHALENYRGKKKKKIIDDSQDTINFIIKIG